jgi:D-lactate dehydrogenase (cytochrome)
MTKHVDTSPFTPDTMRTAQYHDLLAQCVHCGMCLEVCPTYAIFGTEMDSPRGRIDLMRAAAQGRLGKAEFLGPFAEYLNTCLECRACETACSSDVQYHQLIEVARTEIEQARKVGLIERVVRQVGLRGFMPRLPRLKLIARFVWLYQASGLQSLVRGLKVLPGRLRTMEAILPPVTRTFPDYRQRFPASGEKRGTVAFFHGCIQEAFLSRVNAATIRVLQHNGYEVFAPNGQTCCGAAQLHTGDEEMAKRLARQNIDAFLASGCTAIINNAGGCGVSLKEYPTLLADDPDYREKARRFAALVYDFNEFLSEHLNAAPEGRLPVRATYVDSCHLRHGQGIVSQPRDLLRAIPGLELIELEQPGRCCGSAGVYNIVRPDIADIALADKVADITATGAQVVVISNTGCHMQIEAGVREAGLSIPVLHVAEMLDLSYRAERLPARRAMRPTTRPRAPRWRLWQARRIDQDGGFEALKRQLKPGQVIDDPVALLAYQYDGSIEHGHPAAAVFPASTGDVQKVVAWAIENRVPLISRGAGTGLSGGAVASGGGLLLVTSQMKAIRRIDAAARNAVVEAGVVTDTLGRALQPTGLVYPPDPVSACSSTIGGNVATNAGGPHCFKYGVTSNYVTGMEVVLATGESIRLGGQALDYPEIDLAGLMTGSEGTLGVITEISVRLRREAPAVRTLMAAFDTLEQAGDAVSTIVQRGLMPATLEMMDQQMMVIIESFVKARLPIDAGGALIIEVDGYPRSVDRQIADVAALLREIGVRDLRVAENDAEREQIWYGRKNVVGALARMAPSSYTIDVTVPRSYLAKMLLAVNDICERLDLRVGHVFHAGDGNLHPVILIDDPEDEALIARIHEAAHEISALCVEMGGSITGEHGIGIEKRDYMTLQHGPAEIATMADVKDVFDPAQLLNPDKVLPPGPGEAPTLPTPADVVASPVAPTSAEEAASLMRACAAAERSIRILGGGTKSAPLPPTDVSLSTGKLSGIHTLNLDDLYVTAGAGTPFADLQARLEAEQMWVPVISPWADATVGGIVSTNFNAPLRTRYGSIRDLVLGLTAVLPDGRIIHSGRPVMKDVAGYNLASLFIGSHGVMGLVTDVTFRLFPLPRCQATMSVEVEGLADGLRRGQQIAGKALNASSILLYRTAETDAAYTLRYTVDGLEEDAAAEMAEVRALLSDMGDPSPQAGQPGSLLWGSWIEATPQDATLVRIGLPSSALAALSGPPFEAALNGGEFIADLTAGLVYLRGDLDVTALRAAVKPLGGYVVVLNGTDACDRWGYVPEGLDMMRALKGRWDPAGLINRGVFIV